MSDVKQNPDQQVLGRQEQGRSWHGSHDRGMGRRRGFRVMPLCAPSPTTGKFEDITYRDGFNLSRMRHYRVHVGEYYIGVVMGSRSHGWSAMPKGTPDNWAHNMKSRWAATKHVLWKVGIYSSSL